MKTAILIPERRLSSRILNFLYMFLIPGIAGFLFHNLKASFEWESITIDPNLWPLLILAFFCWLLIVSASCFILAALIRKTTAQKTTFNLETFNQLSLWQQYVLYMALYALLVFSAIGSLIAIC